MCCRTHITPLIPDLAATILTVGQFTTGDDGRTWRRNIPEEDCVVVAHLMESGEDPHLELAIQPVITQMAHHHGKRITAGVYFEIAVRYAEKAGGRIVQKANVEGCTDGGMQSRVLADYGAGDYMDWNRICNGFRQSLLGELGEV